MKLQTVGWIALSLQVVLLLIWVWSIFFVRNGTDPAGKGLAMAFIVALCVWIFIGIVLMLLDRKWSTIVALVMACIPLAIAVIGVLKQYGTHNNNF